MWGEEWRRCRETYWGMEPQHTFNSPHLPTLTFPLTSPTPHHTFLHLLSYLFPHLPFLPPHPNTFSYYPYIILHFLKVWQSYYVTKFLWQSYCGEVTMWQSYWQPNKTWHRKREEATKRLTLWHAGSWVGEEELTQYRSGHSCNTQAQWPSDYSSASDSIGRRF